MTALIRSLVAGRSLERRADDDFTWDDYARLWSIDSPFFVGTSALSADNEQPDPSLLGFASGVFGRNSVAFSCLMARWKLFSQARFQFQQLFGGREGQLFGTTDLAILEHPERGLATVDLLFRAIQYADLGGDWFGVRRQIRGTQLKSLRPDWTTIVLGSRNPQIPPEEIGLDPDTEIVGYAYQPGGTGDPIAYGPEEVAHFAPTPNPLLRYRGMPLLVAAMREILGDSAATSHKLAFFRHAATPNIAITLPANMDIDKARAWKAEFEKTHGGSLNAYKTLFFGGGMTASAVGSTFQQMTFKELQGQAETRIAAATGIHPVIVALSEGLQGSSLNAGNFDSAARSTADVTLRYLWLSMSGALETIVPPAAGTRLWYDERSIPFLQANVKDRAEVLHTNAETITSLVKEGFTPASAIDAVTSGDMTRLQHTGLVSVQLQPPGAMLPAAYRATREFWATGGPLAELGPVPAGMVLPAGHPLVQAFPSLFVPADAPPKVIGPGLLVTRAEVVARRQALLATGREAGYDTLAAEFGVSRDTIRRRLHGN